MFSLVGIEISGRFYLLIESSVGFCAGSIKRPFGEFEPLVDMTYRNFAQLLVQQTALPFKYERPKFWTEEFVNWEAQNEPKQTESNQWITIQEGKVQGRVMGGNLNTIQGIWGSEYMPQICDGDILFVEDSLKDASTVERSFSLLKVNGVFDKISGIILGKHELFDDKNTGLKPSDILLEVLRGQDLPILSEFDCSHTHPMFTLPIGVEIELDATSKSVSILEEWCL